jgi:RimJ/RimL family protein N-acetyltransferase
MTVLQTERLIIRPFTLDDAEFILTLLNEPSFLRHIGDKKVRSLGDAQQYLRTGPMASYELNGFGPCAVELRDTHTPIGMSGLLKRAELPHPDIGFAFLPDFWGKGLAFEAATAVIDDARERLNVTRVLAIVNPDNEASINLLQRLGLKFERLVKLAKDRNEVKLFSLDLP